MKKIQLKKHYSTFRNVPVATLRTLFGNRAFIGWSGLFCLVLCASIVLGGNQRNTLALAFVQDDWSGGIGTENTQFTSASNLTATAPGAITVDADNVTNWCNVPTCDSNWPYRQVNTVHNNGGTFDNRPILFNIDYRNGMKADFSDLRFTDGAGSILPHYLLDKTDATEARAWVKLGLVETESDAVVYMYFGNSSAASTSDGSAVTFHDAFDDNQWETDWASGNALTHDIENGFILLDTDTPNYDEVATRQSFDPSVDGYIVQYDTSTDNFSCENSYSNNFAFLANSEYYSLGKVANSAASCQSQLEVGHPGSYTRGTADVTPLNGTVTYRAVVDAAGNHDWFYSTDKGRSFNIVEGYDRTIGATNAPFTISAAAWNATERSFLKFGNVTITKSGPTTSLNYGNIEYLGGKSGSLISKIYDTVGSPVYGTVNYETSGTGSLTLKVRTSTNSDMSGATDWRDCPSVASGDNIVNTCASNSQRYIQYFAYISSAAGGNFALNSVTLNYIADLNPPSDLTNIVMRKGEPWGDIITDPDGWTNIQPYLSWDVPTDDVSGVAGYCAYIGQDSNPNFSTTAGLITIGSLVDTHGACQYATPDPQIWANGFDIDYNQGEQYYFVIAPIDNNGRIGNPTVKSFGMDLQQPTIATVMSAPIATNTKAFTVSWINVPGTGILDFESGALGGFKYCVESVLQGFDGCSDKSGNNFWGSSHENGSFYDRSDLIPFSAGELTMQPEDFDRIDDSIVGANFVHVYAFDRAGNYNEALSQTVITSVSASAPNNLQVTPTSNSENAFSFTWDTPSFSAGPASELQYCWSVNTQINSDGSNCTNTGKGITQLAEGAYATQQGENTFYIATRDITGNFDNTQVASVTFTANTTAPGVPQDLDISDVSTRATSTWKLALSWTAPELEGSGIHHYRILRSTDGTNFTEAGTTTSSNTSFIDSGLSQQPYYYRVQACDSANSCSAPSDTVNRRPTGRYTEPARLTADTDQPKVKSIGTKSTTVFWFTDRESDSKVAYGTTPGTYFPEEVGNSQQTSNHVVTLNNLQPNTTYYYRSKWTDGDGNTGQSVERSFTTSPPPTISEVEATGVGVSSANISFRSKDASKVNLYFGTSDSLGGFTSTNTAQRESTYSLPLSDLIDGTKYTYKISGVDSDGNEYGGDTYSFTTPSLPKITDLAFQPVEGAPSSTLKVTWKTNVPASSQLSFGPKDGSRTERVDNTLVSEHAIVLTGLVDDTLYTLNASSVDTGGNTAKSDLQTFKTSLDTRPPKISDVVVESSVRGSGSQARGQIVVSWKTDEPATSQVAFGIGENGALTSKSSEDTRLTLEHTVVVSDIPTSSIYRVAAVSNDKGQNTTNSESITAIIGRGSENVFNIIFDALQRIFGISS